MDGAAQPERTGAQLVAASTGPSLRLEFGDGQSVEIERDGWSWEAAAENEAENDDVRHFTYTGSRGAGPEVDVGFWDGPLAADTATFVAEHEAPFYRSVSDSGSVESRGVLLAGSVAATLVVANDGPEGASIAHLYVPVGGGTLELDVPSVVGGPLAVADLIAGVRVNGAPGEPILPPDLPELIPGEPPLRSLATQPGSGCGGEKDPTYNQYPCCSGKGANGGNCTWYSGFRRPDLKAVANLGNAKDWAANAKRNGFGVSSTCSPGSIVSYPANVKNVSGSYGHVAYVVSCGTSTLTADEQNCDYQWGTTRGASKPRGVGEQYIAPRAVNDPQLTGVSWRPLSTNFGSKSIAITQSFICISDDAGRLRCRWHNAQTGQMDGEWSQPLGTVTTPVQIGAAEAPNYTLMLVAADIQDSRNLYLVWLTSPVNWAASQQRFVLRASQPVTHVAAATDDTGRLAIAYVTSDYRLHLAFATTNSNNAFTTVDLTETTGLVPALTSTGGTRYALAIRPRDLAGVRLTTFSQGAAPTSWVTPQVPRTTDQGPSIGFDGAKQRLLVVEPGTRPDQSMKLTSSFPTSIDGITSWVALPGTTSVRAAMGGVPWLKAVTVVHRGTDGRLYYAVIRF